MKLLNDTKARFIDAYLSSGLSKTQFDNMLYFMNILNLLKPYDESISSHQLFLMIKREEY